MCVFDSPQQATTSLACLESTTPLDIVDADEFGGNEIAARAIPHVVHSMCSRSKPALAVKLPLESESPASFDEATNQLENSPHSLHTNNELKDQVANLEKELRVVASRYRELFRCARTIESELLDVLYKWIPEHVEAMAPLQNIQLVEEAAHDILDGKYALSQEIGRGRFGQVFACTMADGRRLAVKRMSKHKHMNTRKMARLCDCLSILHEPERGRRHPNILYLERVMQSPTHFYMVMARMPGDLYEFIGHECTVEGGLDEPIALDVIRPVLSALHHLHRLGYAHRDIKSENILVDSRRAVGSVVEVVDVKLIDFDMSCQLAAPPPPFGSSTQGSLGFMAPEVLFREIPDHGKLDVWSAACVLLEMSMGRKWFNAVWVQAYSAYAKREKEVRGILGGRERAYEDLRQSLSHNAAVAMDVISSPTGIVRELLELALDINPTTRASMSAAHGFLFPSNEAGDQDNFASELPMLPGKDRGRSSTTTTTTTSSVPDEVGDSLMSLTTMKAGARQQHDRTTSSVLDQAEASSQTDDVVSDVSDSLMSLTTMTPRERRQRDDKSQQSDELSSLSRNSGQPPVNRWSMPSASPIGSYRSHDGGAAYTSPISLCRSIGSSATTTTALSVDSSFEPRRPGGERRARNDGQGTYRPMLPNEHIEHERGRRLRQRSVQAVPDL